MEHSFYGWIWQHSAILVLRSSAEPHVGCPQTVLVSVDSYFQVSPEMLDWVQVEPLARPCKVIHCLTTSEHPEEGFGILWERKYFGLFNLTLIGQK